MIWFNSPCYFRPIVDILNFRFEFKTSLLCAVSCCLCATGNLTLKWNSERYFSPDHSDKQGIASREAWNYVNAKWRKLNTTFSGVSVNSFGTGRRQLYKNTEEHARDNSFKGTNNSSEARQRSCKKVIDFHALDWFRFLHQRLSFIINRDYKFLPINLRESYLAASQSNPSYQHSINRSINKISSCSVSLAANLS